MAKNKGWLVVEDTFEYNDQYYYLTEGVSVKPTLYMDKAKAEEARFKVNKETTLSLLNGGLGDYVGEDTLDQVILPGHEEAVYRILYPKEINMSDEEYLDKMDENLAWNSYEGDESAPTLIVSNLTDDQIKVLIEGVKIFNQASIKEVEIEE